MKKPPVTITPVINEQGDMPEDLKIKWGFRVNIDWDWFFGLFKKKPKV